jgi:hypothetical protein
MHDVPNADGAQRSHPDREYEQFGQNCVFMSTEAVTVAGWDSAL